MRAEKKMIVDEIKKQVSGSSYVFLARFTGMNVTQVNELRKRLDAAAADYHVVKNSMLLHAAKEVGLPISGPMTGQTAIIYGRKGKDAKAQTDPVAAAKALRGYMKEFEKPRFKAAFMDGKPLSEADLVSLASLPTREVLLATLLGLLNSPAQRLLFVLNAKSSEFLAVLKAYEDKKQKETQGKS
jgi:large subunit ribosomal protein L10